LDGPHVTVAKGGAAAINSWKAANKGNSLFLCSATLPGTDFAGADLAGTNFIGANLAGANFAGANLAGANFRGALITSAIFTDANLNGAVFNDANLTCSNLTRANFGQIFLSRTEMGGVTFNANVFADVDLSETLGLTAVNFRRPCTIGIDTLMNSKGQIPRSFLLGCGVPAWMYEVNRLCNPELSTGEVAEIGYTLFDARAKGSAFTPSNFISYSSKNEELAQRLRDSFIAADVPAWLDLKQAYSARFFWPMRARSDCVPC
jgi:uncharacterized protein YjbI with pentapeptide repeats